jgi:hypothetical protein
MASGNESQCETHALDSEIARNQARSYRHRRIVDDREPDREQQQRLVARADIHEDLERQTTEKVDCCKPVERCARLASPPDNIIPPKFTADSTPCAVALGNRGNPHNAE